MARGVEAGLVSAQLRDDDPALIWTVDDNDWVYEARLTTAGQALYHGYPLLPRDAFARKIIARYLDWVYGQRNLTLANSARLAQDRYAQ